MKRKRRKTMRMRNQPEWKSQTEEEEKEEDAFDKPSALKSYLQLKRSRRRRRRGQGTLQDRGPSPYWRGGVERVGGGPYDCPTLPSTGPGLHSPHTLWPGLSRPPRRSITCCNIPETYCIRAYILYYPIKRLYPCRHTALSN
jgi:hypothetical protein